MHTEGGAGHAHHNSGESKKPVSNKKRSPLPLKGRTLIPLPGAFTQWVDPNGIACVRHQNEGDVDYVMIHTDQGYWTTLLPIPGQTIEELLDAVESLIKSVHKVSVD